VWHNALCCRPQGEAACKELDRKRPQMSKTDRQSRNRFIDPATLGELESLARSRPQSGRQAAAKASAWRTLERLARHGRRAELPPCPPDWHPMPGTAWEELDRAQLEEHPEVRQRMWEQWHGY
jgi:hypothetical protein